MELIPKTVSVCDSNFILENLFFLNCLTYFCFTSLKIQIYLQPGDLVKSVFLWRFGLSPVISLGQRVAGAQKAPQWMG